MRRPTAEVLRHRPCSSKQQQLARKKDVITRWFGEWDEVNGTAWQSAIIGKSTPGRRAEEIGDRLERHAQAG